MKVKINIFLHNPKSQTNDEKEIIKNVGKKIQVCVSDNHDLPEEKELFATLFLNRPSIPDEFVDLNNNIYFRDLTNQNVNGWLALVLTVKSSLKRIELPKSIKNVAVVLSLEKVEENDIFAINSSNENSTISFKAIEPQFSLDEVIMNDAEKESLIRALTIITKRDLIFDYWGFSKIDKSTKSVICFHGAAGTGKTRCAHAVAKYLGKKLLIGSYSQIQSKFVGEGEKNLVAYFKAAEEQDAVLFIDEADTFLSRRLPSSNENSKHYNSMSNELYQLIENFNGCIVFASNHITDFDPAVISRIIEPIEFKLPDKNTRIKLIKIHLPANAPIKLTDEQLDEIATLTEGLSGRDIRKAMLLFLSDVAYNNSNVEKTEYNKISASFNELREIFCKVKKAKTDLDNSVKGFNLGAKIVEVEKRNTRYLQVAAHMLWADGNIDDKEKKLFKEISSKFAANVDINDRNSLPTLEEICNRPLSKIEKIQLLDVACRMAAIDGTYHDAEKAIIFEMSTLLGLDVETISKIDKYILSLVDEFHEWEKITSSFHSQEYAIIESLKKEYSEGAAWQKLGIAYQNGESISDYSVPKNPQRAEQCFEKARALGYISQNSNLK